MPPIEFFVVYAALVGLIVGSYLNVVVHRLPHQQSTVVPRSRCPKCGAAIRARDNLPVLSWLLLRGRCRDCGARISARYPLIELLTAALFAGCRAALRRLRPTAAAGALFCAALLALAAIDVEHFLLPDRITLPGIALGLARAAAPRPGIARRTRSRAPSSAPASCSSWRGSGSSCAESREWDSATSRCSP